MKSSANQKRATLVALLVWALIAPSGQAQTTASGQGSIAIGAMNGGTVNLGLSAGDVERLFKARGKEQAKLIKELVEKLNHQAQREAFTVGAVQQFLLTIDRKHVPQADLAQALADITRRYLELESRLASISVTSIQIKTLIEQAEAARKSGQFEKAEGLLEQASMQSLREMQEAMAKATEMRDQSARIKASQASLALIQLNRPDRFVRAAQWLEQAFDLKVAAPDSAALWWLFEAAEAHVLRGHLASARSVLSKAHLVAVEQAARFPENTDWQRDLSVSHNKLADVLLTLGEREKALGHYRDGMAIREKLARRDPENTEWQTDWVVSLWKLGSWKGDELSAELRQRWLQTGLQRLELLAQANRLTAQQADWAAQFKAALAALK